MPVRKPAMAAGVALNDHERHSGFSLQVGYHLGADLAAVTLNQRKTSILCWKARRFIAPFFLRIKASSTWTIPSLPPNMVASPSRIASRLRCKSNHVLL